MDLPMPPSWPEPLKTLMGQAIKSLTVSLWKTNFKKLKMSNVNIKLTKT